MKRGQVTITNLVVLAVTLLLLFTFVIPVLQPLIDSTVIDLQASPNEYTPIIVALLQLVPLFLTLSILMTAIHYANPRKEGIA